MTDSSSDRFASGLILDGLLETMEQGVSIIEVIYDQDGAAVDYVFLQTNPAFEKHTGLRNAVGKTMRELVPDIETHWVERYDRIVKTGQATTFEESSMVMGREFSVHAARAGSASSNQVAILFSDVTAQRAAQTERAASEARLQQFVQGLPLAAAMFDNDMNYLVASHLWVENYVPNKDDITGLNHYDLMPHCPDHWRAVHLQCLEGETVKVAEDTRLSLNGSLLVTRHETRPWYLEDGRIGGIYIVEEDITAATNAARELVRQADKLASQLAELDTLYTEAPLGLAFIDADLKFRRVNAALAAMNGLPASDHLGKLIWDIVPDLRESGAPLFKKVLEDLQPLRNLAITGETPAQPGVIREWVEHFYPVADSALGINGIGIVVEDVTQKNHLERLAKESETRVRRTLDQLFVFVGIVSFDGILVDANRAPIEAGGLTRDDVIGKPFKDAAWWSHSLDARARLDEAIVRAKRGETVRYDVRVKMALDELVMIDFQIAPLLGESGVITELIASAVVIEDRVRIYDELQQLAEELEQRVDRRTSELKATAERLTEEMRQREMMQAALIQSQKLEAIGQLTAGIAHDFNNAIAAIAGGYDLITRRTDNPQILEIAEHGKKAAHRGAKLVQHLLAFSRQQPLASTNTDVGQLLREIEPLLRHSIGPHITMTVTEPADLPRVFVDPVQLESVMINLAINARDAMGDGGVLEIRIEPCLADAPRRPTELGSRDAIGIHFCDNGTGMTPEVLARVIEPFFTTKPMGLGTGLGLAMVHGFALQSEGALSITSKMGEGTIVSVFLPIATMDDAALPTGAGREHDWGDVQTLSAQNVLLIDDDPDVRAITEKLLIELGHTVFVSANLHMAQDLVREKQIDVALLDVMMPDMDGPTIAEALRAIYPALPVIFMTGHADRKNLGHELVLDKPFSTQKLMEAFRSVLAKRASIS